MNLIIDLIVYGLFVLFTPPKKKTIHDDVDDTNKEFIFMDMNGNLHNFDDSVPDMDTDDNNVKSEFDYDE